MCCVYLLKIFNKSLDRVKVEPVLCRFVIKLVFSPYLPAQADAYALVNAENLVMLNEHPLPSYNFISLALIREPLTLT